MSGAVQAAWASFGRRAELIDLLRGAGATLEADSPAGAVIQSLRPFLGRTDLTGEQLQLIDAARDHLFGALLADLESVPAVRLQSELPFVPRISSQLPLEPPEPTKQFFESQGINPIRGFFFGPNRNDPVRRAIRAAKALREEWGYFMPIVVMYSDGDETKDYVTEADYAFKIEGGLDAFLNIDAVVGRLLSVVAHYRIPMTDVFPGWGMLSENPRFAAALEARGLAMIGPFSWSMALAGPKDTAKAIAVHHGVPVAQNSSSIPINEDMTPNIDHAQGQAEAVGFPLMIKPIHGGGGKGQERVDSPDELAAKLLSSVRTSQKTFGSSQVMFERYIEGGRHVEVQVVGAGKQLREPLRARILEALIDNAPIPDDVISEVLTHHGALLDSIQVVGERICSAQRRHQKVFEWGGPDILDEDIRMKARLYAQLVAAAISYKGPGTIEFLLDKSNKIFFMEMNTRLQVEHLVTEEEYLVDLMKEIIKRQIGLDPSPAFARRIQERPQRYVLNFRLLFEDVPAGFVPAPGPVKLLLKPEGPHVRTDTGVEGGDQVSAAYDNMGLKLTTMGDTWDEALAEMKTKMAELIVLGPKTNLEFAAEFLDTDEMRRSGGMGVTVNFMEQYAKTRQAFLDAKRGPIPAYVTEAMDPDSDAFYDLDEVRRHFYLKYGSQWREITDPFLFKENDDLIRALVLAHSRGEEIASQQIQYLVDRYGSRWAEPKPHQDEAMIGVAIHAYHERRAEIARKLLHEESDYPFTQETFPPEHGLDFQATIDGKLADIQVREISLTRFAVTVNGRTVLVNAERKDLYTYAIKRWGEQEADRGNSYKIYVHGEQGAFNVRVGSTVFTHEIKLVAAGAKEDKGAVASPMPGKVVRLAPGLKVGDKVKKGDTLLIVEAMKMENKIMAPIAGCVVAVDVQVGSTVSARQLLVRIEPETDETEETEAASYEFMPRHRVGIRAQLGYIEAAQGSEEYERVMQRARGQLSEIAPSLLSYVGDYLKGLDYHPKQLERYLLLLETMPQDAITEEFKQAYVRLLTEYSDLQQLFSYDAQVRDEFDYFLRHWRSMSSTISPQLAGILRTYLGHFGIVIPAGQAIAPDEVGIRTHSFENALLRIRRAWTNGERRKEIMARIIGLMSRYGIREAQEVAHVIHTRAKAGDAIEVVQAIESAARAQDARFYDQLTSPHVPEFLLDRYRLLQDNIFEGISDQKQFEMAMSLAVASNNASEPGIALADHPKLLRLARVHQARVSELVSPHPDIEAFMFEYSRGGGRVQSVVTYAVHDGTLNLEYDERGVFSREAQLEDLYIRSAQLIRAYGALAADMGEQRDAIAQCEIFLELRRDVKYDREGETTDPQTFTNERLQRIGRNIQPFTNGTIVRTTAFAGYRASDGRREAAFQFMATDDGELIPVRQREEDFYTVGRPTDEHHKKGRLTVEERARILFDGGRYNILQLKGVDDQVDAAGAPMPNAILLTEGIVDDVPVVAYLSDAREKGGAVGAAEGQKMAAAAIIAYLRGIPLISFNDSGGAKIPEGTRSLDYSGVDFFMKAVAQLRPEAVASLINAHPNREYFLRVIKQFGDGRPLYEQIRHIKRPPLQVALMAGANSGMVVYGPAELVHVAMRRAVQVFGVLTGRTVIYEVLNQWMNNSDIGGVEVLLKKAGTVGYETLTEDELVQLSKIFITLFYKNFHPDFEVFENKIRRGTPQELGLEEALKNIGRGRVLSPAQVALNTDQVSNGLPRSSVLPYKEGFRNSEGVMTSYAVMGGRTVAIVGPLHQQGFGTKQAIEKADRFIRGAVQEGLPIIRVYGEHWIRRHMAGDGETVARREELASFLSSDAAQTVPQIAIIMHLEGLTSLSGNLGTQFQIFVRSPSTPESMIYLAKRKGVTVVDNQEAAFDLAMRLAQYTSSPKGWAPSVPQFDSRNRSTQLLDKIIPANHDIPYDMRRVLGIVFDEGSFVEIGHTDQADSEGSNLITGFATLNGGVVGVFADDVQIRAGSASWADADKFRRFVETCEHLGIPMVYMEDCPGFEPGVGQESRDIQGRGGQLIKAIATSTVPKMKIVLRKSNGGRNIQGFHPWMTTGTYAVALENAIIAVMGARGAIPFVYKRDKGVQAIIGSIPAKIASFIEACRHVCEGLTPEKAELRATLESQIANIEQVREDFQFKRLDQVKTMIGEYEKNWKGQIADSSEMDRVIADLKTLLNAVQKIVDLYNKQIAAPEIARKNGVIDAIEPAANLRVAMIQGLEQAKLRAAQRPYPSLTGHEAEVAHALHQLHRLGLDARARYRVAHDSDADLIQLDDAVGPPMRARDILQIISLFPDQPAPAVKQRLIDSIVTFSKAELRLVDSIVTFAKAELDAREALLSQWRVTLPGEMLVAGAEHLSAVERYDYLAGILGGAIRLADQLLPGRAATEQGSQSVTDLLAALAVARSATDSKTVEDPSTESIPYQGTTGEHFVVPHYAQPSLHLSGSVFRIPDSDLPNLFDDGVLERQVAMAKLRAVLADFAASRKLPAVFADRVLAAVTRDDDFSGVISIRIKLVPDTNAVKLEGYSAEGLNTVNVYAAEVLHRDELLPHAEDDRNGFIHWGLAVKDQYAHRARYDWQDLPASPTYDPATMRAQALQGMMQQALNAYALSHSMLPSVVETLQLMLQYGSFAARPQVHVDVSLSSMLELHIKAPSYNVRATLDLSDAIKLRKIPPDYKGGGVTLTADLPDLPSADQATPEAMRVFIKTLFKQLLNNWAMEHRDAGALFSKIEPSLVIQIQNTGQPQPHQVVFSTAEGQLHLEVQDNRGVALAQANSQLFRDGTGLVLFDPYPETWSGKPGLVHSGMIQSQFEAVLNLLAAEHGFTRPQIHALARNTLFYRQALVGESGTIMVTRLDGGRLQMELVVQGIGVPNEGYWVVEHLIAQTIFEPLARRRSTFVLSPEALKSDYRFTAYPTSVASGIDNAQGLGVAIQFDEAGRRLWTKLAPSQAENRLNAMLLAGDEVAYWTGTLAIGNLVRTVESRYTPYRFPEADDEIYAVAHAPQVVPGDDQVSIRVDFVDALGMRIGTQQLIYSPTEGQRPVEARTHRSLVSFVESVRALQQRTDPHSQAFVSFLGRALGERFEALMEDARLRSFPAGTTKVAGAGAGTGAGTDIMPDQRPTDVPPPVVRVEVESAPDPARSAEPTKASVVGGLRIMDQAPQSDGTLALSIRSQPEVGDQTGPRFTIVDHGDVSGGEDKSVSELSDRLRAMGMTQEARHVLMARLDEQELQRLSGALDSGDRLQIRSALARVVTPGRPRGYASIVPGQSVLRAGSALKTMR